MSFRLLTGTDERRMAALRRAAGERPITTLRGFRLETIDKVEPRDKQRFIEDLSMADVTFLFGEFDRVDCGVDRDRGRMRRVLRGHSRRAPFREGLLPAGEAQEGAGDHHLFPDVDVERWREAMFQLCWHQHGGSGLAITFADALELSVHDRDWLLERIGAQRSREAKELEKAARRR